MLGRDETGVGGATPPGARATLPEGGRDTATPRNPSPASRRVAADRATVGFAGQPKQPWSLRRCGLAILCADARAVSPRKHPRLPVAGYP